MDEATTTSLAEHFKKGKMASPIIAMAKHSAQPTDNDASLAQDGERIERYSEMKFYEFRTISQYPPSMNADLTKIKKSAFGRNQAGNAFAAEITVTFN